MTETQTARQHIDRYASVDGCTNHGLGFGICRVCLTNDRIGNVPVRKHRAEGETVEGFDIRL